ncbi:substrate-binding periplasmic protein [Kiloniella antarctica]|uniref:Substrate-binding periplasmic protein n=1 Tax=Kiloniella antarctica TaxID=1550907 RepID=A0ABW5BIT0_9PROT
MLNLLGGLAQAQVIAPEIASTPEVAQTKPQVRIVTDEFAPLQYLNDGTPDGYVTEYIQAIIERVKRVYSFEATAFEFLPWKRALLEAKTAPNTLFFSLSRTAEREPHYQWLGTVSPYRQSFYKLKKNTHITVENLNALRDSAYVVGIQRGGSAQSLVDKLGFKQARDYTTYTHYSQGIQMLYNDRIDMLPLTDFLARNAACRGGFNGDLLTPVIAINTLANPLWATFSNNSDQQLVVAFKAAMTDLKEEGIYQEILDRHLTNWNNQPCIAEESQ